MLTLNVDMILYGIVDFSMNVGEVGAYPHTEACPHTLLFAHRVTSG